MRRFRKSFVLVAAFLAVAFAAPARADIATSAEHAIIMDGETGQVLWAKDADTATPPASMSKLMTLELLFQRLKSGSIKLTDTFPVSQRAYSERGGSECFVKDGDNMPVEAVIRCIIIASGNDACIVAAEAIGGTVENFVDMMNRRAKQLGLNQSHFVNPNGLPDPPGQLMSVHDLAKLARHLIYDYPQYYHYFSEQSFTWSGITQQNRDAVIGLLPGTDGLKTGHTDAAGYGIVISTVRNGQRLILVLNGLRYPQLDKMSTSAQDWHGVRLRAEEAARVMGLAFREFRHFALFKAGETVGNAVVWEGARDTVPVVTGAPINLTMQVESRAGMKVAFVYDGPVKAPIVKGQQIGTVNVTAPDFPGLKIPVYAGESVSGAGFFGRIFVGLRALVSGHAKGS